MRLYIATAKIMGIAVLLLFSAGIQGLGASAPGGHSQVKKHKPTPTPSPPPTSSPDEESNSAKVRMATGFIFVGFFLYWIPAFVGFSRHHHNRGAIAVTNLLLGWTVLGWIAALIWACTNPANKA